MHVFMNMCVHICVYMFEHVMYVYMCMHGRICVCISVSVEDRRIEGDGVFLLSAHKKTSERAAMSRALCPA